MKFEGPGFGCHIRMWKTVALPSLSNENQSKSNEMWNQGTSSMNLPTQFLPQTSKETRNDKTQLTKIDQCSVWLFVFCFLFFFFGIFFSLVFFYRYRWCFDVAGEIWRWWFDWFELERSWWGRKKEDRQKREGEKQRNREREREREQGGN